MANPEHLEILNKDSNEWNKWRRDNPVIQPDLSKADLTGADLTGADLTGADLTGADLGLAFLTGAILTEAILDGADLTSAKLTSADLTGAHLTGAHLGLAFLTGAILTEAILNGADLRGADLRGANLMGASLEDADLMQAILWRADLRGANLCRADLFQANLFSADLTGADLRRANLRLAHLGWANLEEADLRGANLELSAFVGTRFMRTNLAGCRVYGISAWDLELDDETIQKGLIITESGKPEITVDNLEVAQFIYLITNNEKVSDIINVMRTKAVLILGAFEGYHLDFLNQLKEELHLKDFLPIIFNFPATLEQTFMSTVKTLALLSHAVIVDLSLGKGQLSEVGNLVPDTYVPFIYIAREGSDITGMTLFEHCRWQSKQIITYPKQIEDAKEKAADLVDNNILPIAMTINKYLFNEKMIAREQYYEEITRVRYERAKDTS
jgi:uncharacterized protein YjbI with pentapeptide repeats